MKARWFLFLKFLQSSSMLRKMYVSLYCLMTVGSANFKVIIKHTSVRRSQCVDQRHTLRDRWPSTVLWGKKNCTGPTAATKARQKSLVPAQRAQRFNQGRTPFLCTPWVPIHLGFNSQFQQDPSLVSLVSTQWLRFTSVSGLSCWKLWHSLDGRNCLLSAWIWPSVV